MPVRRDSWDVVPSPGASYGMTVITLLKIWVVKNYGPPPPEGPTFKPLSQVKVAIVILNIWFKIIRFLEN